MKQAFNLVHKLSLQGNYCSLFSGAGTGTYDIDVHVPYLTEIQSGSYVVMDVEYQSIGSMENRKNCNYFLLINL